MSDVLNKEQLKYYTTGLKGQIQVELTRAEYDALATKNVYTDYFISDENIVIKNGIEYLVATGTSDYLKTSSDQVVNGYKTFTSPIGLKNGIMTGRNQITLPEEGGTLALLSDIVVNPTIYIKSVTVSGNTLTITKQDDTTITYTAELADTSMTYKGMCKQSELAGKTSTASKGDFWFLSDYGGQAAVYNGSAWKYLNSTYTIDSNISSTSTNPPSSNAVYSYCANYHDATKLNRNGTNTMNNALTSYTTYPFSSNNTDYMEYYGGSAWNTGGFIKLHNGNKTGDGRVELFAHNGSYYRQLILHPNNDSIAYNGEEIYFTNVDEPTITYTVYDEYYINNISFVGSKRLSANMWYIHLTGTLKTSAGTGSNHKVLKNLKINDREPYLFTPLSGYVSKDGVYTWAAARYLDNTLCFQPETGVAKSNKLVLDGIAYLS